jgi:hypothetical protein
LDIHFTVRTSCESAAPLAEKNAAARHHVLRRLISLCSFSLRCEHPVYFNIVACRAVAMDNREMGRCTRAVSEQRFCKHIRGTIEVLLEMGCVFVVRAEELCWKQFGRPVQFCTWICEHRTWRRQRNSHCWSRCQITSSNRLRTLGLCVTVNCKVWKQR